MKIHCYGIEKLDNFNHSDQKSMGLSIQSHIAPKLLKWDQIWQERWNNHAIPRLMYVVTWGKRPWMFWHPFHMFCGCMGKVLQAWDILNILGSCSSKPQNTQAVWLDLARTTRPPNYFRSVHVVKWITTGHGYVTKYTKLFMGTCARSNQPEIESIHMGNVHLYPQSTQAVGVGSDLAGGHL